MTPAYTPDDLTEARENVVRLGRRLRVQVMAMSDGETAEFCCGINVARVLAERLDPISPAAAPISSGRSLRERRRPRALLIAGGIGLAQGLAIGFIAGVTAALLIVGVV